MISSEYKKEGIPLFFMLPQNYGILIMSFDLSSITKRSSIILSI